MRFLFFADSGVMGFFHYLKYGLSIMLSFIGVKMIIMPWYHIPTEIALGVIASVLAVSILASIVFREKES